MSNPNRSSSSKLGAVLQHERDLRAQREAARREARSIVEQAHVDAARVVDDLNKSLSDETNALHVQAEAARVAERKQLMADAQARVEAERGHARTKVADAVREIVAMVLPGRKAEG